MFRGINSVALDTNGRIKLPVRHSRQLLAYESTSIVVTIDADSPCLLLYPMQEWEFVEEKLQALPSFNPAARRIQRLLIGHASDLELDAKKRILLPELLRDYAGISREVMAVGQGKKIELWAANIWLEYRARWLTEIIKPSDLPDGLQSLAL